MESSFIIDLLSGKESAIQVYEEIKGSELTVASIASVVLYEILRGEEQKPDKVRAFKKLRKKLDVLPFGEREALAASRIEKAIRKAGFSISSLDLLIGATAKTHGAILVSNDKGYQRIKGLRLRTY